jgi:hypothetical protein
MSGKATKKDMNFKRNERKNQTQFQDPQKIIEMIIILNKTKKIDGRLVITSLRVL